MASAPNPHIRSMRADGGVVATTPSKSRMELVAKKNNEKMSSLGLEDPLP